MLHLPDGQSAMGWFRVNRRWAARLALFALALQFALSFAHIHADEIGLPPAAAQASNASSAPYDHEQAPAHDQCAICAVMHLAGTVVPPSPPVLLLPVAIEAAWIAQSFIVYAPAQLRLAQARAPPSA